MIAEDRFVVTGRNVEVTAALRERAVLEVTRALRPLREVEEVHVLFHLESKLRHVCEIVVSAPHLRLVSKAGADDLYDSIHAAAIRLDKMVKKIRERKIHRRRRPARREARRLPVEAPEAPSPDLPEPPRRRERVPAPAAPPRRRIVSIRPDLGSSLTIDQAAQTLEGSADSVLVFREEVSRQLHVLFRRPDGSLGLIAAGEDWI